MPSAGSAMTLEFPAEHPELEDLPLDALPSAPAPVLMPGPPEPAPVAASADRPRPPKLTAGIVGAVAVVVAVVLVVTIAAVTKRRPAGPSPSEVAAPAVTTSIEHTTAPATPDPRPSDEDSARQLLEAQVTNDRPQVEALADAWVPQLSSKRLGLPADGITYDHRAIWTDFANLRARYPGALLLWSGEYSSFLRADFWVTVVPRSYSSGESANSWCDSAGIDKDGCFAKRITHTGGYAGSTVHRK
jgi:serine/threonine-protein kinase